MRDSTHLAQTCPLSLLGLTSAKASAGVGQRRPVGDQEAYGEVNKKGFTVLPSHGPPGHLLPKACIAHSVSNTVFYGVAGKLGWAVFIFIVVFYCFIMHTLC